MTLTFSESAEMQRRAAVDELAATLPEALEREAPGIFAGRYIDNAENGMLVLQIAAPADRVPDSVRRRIAETPHRFERVAVNHQRLEAVRRQWKAQATEYASAGFTLTGIGSDLATNGLVAYVAGDRDAAARHLQADAPQINVRVEAGTNEPTGVSQADLPLRGGVIIRNNVTNPTGTYSSCTSGFTGYRNTVPTTYYIMTAGHCGQPYEDFGQNTFSGSYTGYGLIGNMESSSYYLNSPGDAARVRIADPAKKSNSIIIGPNVTRQITSSAGVGTYGAGAFACLSTTRYMDTDGDFYNCGTITDGSYDYSNTDDYGRSFSSDYGRLGNYKCIPGDSGGPAIDGAKAVGLISARLSASDTRCVVTHIYDALRATGTHGVWPG